MPASGMATASPHASQHRPVTPSPLGDWPSATVPMSPPEQAAAFQGHFSGSSLGPMRHRHVLSFPTQMRGPATPPRTGHNLPGPSSESAYRPIIDENARWKPTQRTRSSQTVHGISLSPPTPLRSVDEPPHRGSQYPQRRRPSSSASSAPSRTANGGPGAHSYTLSDPSPRAPAMQHLATLGDPLWQHNVARQPMASAALVDTSTSATGKRPREARSGTPSARRHTVGSLDEPANLRRHNTTSGAVMGPPIAHVAHASTPDDRATPRAADRARVYAPESPTTPTFANARRQMSDLSRVQQIYLQQNEHFTASLPSLSSSVSSSSLGSDRPRLLSFDESYQEQGIASSGHSDVTSPRSSWHSRSSANDASDTAKPMPPPRSSSLGQEESPASSHHGSVGQMPDTWSSGAGPTFGMVNDAYQGFDQHGRLRHGSLREVRTPHDAALPSSESRPRARTMAFASRQIARLPAGDERARRAQAHSQDEVLASSMAVQLTAAHLRGPEHGYTHAQGARPEGSFEPAKRPKSHSVSSHDSAGPAGTHGSQRWQPSAQDQSWHMRSATTPSGFPLEAHDTPQHPQAMYRSDSRPPASSVVPTGFESFHPRTGRGGRDGPHSVQNVVTVPQRSSSMDVDEYGSPNSGTLTNAGSALPDSSGVVGPRGSGIPAQHAAGPSAGATIASGQAKYECAWCGKRFSRPSSLKIHHHSCVCSSFF